MTQAPEDISYGPVGGSAGLSEFLADRIPRLAASAHRRYRDIPAGDYEQAMWEKALRAGPRFRVLYEAGQYGLIVTKLKDACRKLTGEDRRYRLAAQAAGEGFSVYDIEFYSTRVLGKILPALVEAGFDVSVAMDRAASGTDAAGIHIRSEDPFGGAENYLVVLVDMTKAYERLPRGMQNLLRAYYGTSQEDTDEGRWARDGLASSMGLTREALGMRVHRALQRLQDLLGGADPWL